MNFLDIGTDHIFVQRGTKRPRSHTVHRSEPVMVNAPSMPHEVAAMLFTNSSASFGLYPRRQPLDTMIPRTTHLSAGLTGIFLSTSLPPFSKMKWLRFVLPPSPAPSAVISTRFGSESSGYGSSFCAGRQCLCAAREGAGLALACHLVCAAGLSALRQ